MNLEEVFSSYITFNPREDMGGTWVSIDKLKSNSFAVDLVGRELASICQHIEQIDFLLSYVDCVKIAKALAKKIGSKPVFTVDGLSANDIALIDTNLSARIDALPKRNTGQAIRALIYEDFVMQGAGAVRAANDLRKLGVEVTDVVCLIEAVSDCGRKNLQLCGLSLRSVAELSSQGQLSIVPSPKNGNQYVSPRRVFSGESAQSLTF